MDADPQITVELTNDLPKSKDPLTTTVASTKPHIEDGEIVSAAILITPTKSENEYGRNLFAEELMRALGYFETDDPEDSLMYVGTSNLCADVDGNSFSDKFFEDCKSLEELFKPNLKEWIATEYGLTL